MIITLVLAKRKAGIRTVVNAVFYFSIWWFLP